MTKITTGEAAHILRVSVSWVHKLMADGKLTVLERVGPNQMALLDRKEVERFNKEREGK
ncbi:hypothetical protein LCGC14_2182470 [marine sediment metagenome]|uniref:Helix-turn-helix domain-containing protein n=1 Tax=marine sediment metagenome TaxID=412755 RepID=A0A0F9DLZ3_9ZZZZ